MILVDTGPFVALFEPRDVYHTQCVDILATIQDTLMTTVPVLTEAFHLLGPGSKAFANLRLFISRGGVQVVYLQQEQLLKAFTLMETYADHPMDLADASLVTAAEWLDTRTIMTVDRRDFAAYKIRKGHTHISFSVLGPFQ
ncbi:MAG: PIN domain-containing protein [Desulfovermiculus sp.]|nr:PIN domain-containing protein [Desulfovermiculus sp.]